MYENTLTEKYAAYDIPAVSTTNIAVTECPVYADTAHMGTT